VFETLPTVADGRSPVFCLAHVIGPHPPFVFRADGGPRRPDMPYGLADHTTFFDRGGTAAAYVSGYTEQVAFLNRRILHMIDRLLARPGPAPIIIIQGDHGSRFITEDPGSPRFLAEKLAILNAYYLPGGGNELLYPSITPVNSFRIVLSHYFGMNLPLLPDRVFWAPSDSPLQLTDVTDETGPESVAGGQ
jgi:hypothetical protein